MGDKMQRVKGKANETMGKAKVKASKTNASKLDRLRRRCAAGQGQDAAGGRQGAEQGEVNPGAGRGRAAAFPPPTPRDRSAPRGRAAGSAGRRGRHRRR